MEGKQSLTYIITGATGFLGSGLVNKLVKMGNNVNAIVRPGTKNLYRLEKSANLNVIEVDFFQHALMLDKLNGIKGDVFYHLGWEGVGNTLRNDLIQIKNIEPSVNTLLIAKELNCYKWIGFGSQAEYGPKNKAIKESDDTNPTTLYGSAKLSTCNLSMLYGRQIDLNACWVRIFSTYGPGDNGGWMLIYLIQELLKGNTPSLTLGEQQWDYLYIDDAINGFIEIGLSKDTNGIYNIGNGSTKSIKKYAEIIRDLIDSKLKLGFGQVPYRPDQVMHLEACIDKLTKDTLWKPQVLFEAGIKNTIEWIKTL